MKNCRHAYSNHKGFVINESQAPWLRLEVVKPDPTKPMHSMSICDRPDCISAAKATVEKSTGETAVWVPR